MEMGISHLGLDAFLETSRAGNATAAARTLGVTQSALSQRLSQLEADLEVTLFIRESRGLKLTPAGEKLLRYAQSHRRLEDELLLELRGDGKAVAGMLRVAGFSSVMRSVLIPALAPFLRAHPKVHVDFRSYEVVDLPAVLQRGEADLVVADYRFGRQGVEEHRLGDEEYVVIESARHPSGAPVYLDHGPHDNATESFFSIQSKPPSYYRRSFMGDVYGILEGVEQGLGNAVMSRHLIGKNPRVRVQKGWKRYTREVVMHHYAQAFYPRLQKLVVAELVRSTGPFLKA